MIEILEKLAAADIQILPVTDITTHFVLERGGFAALVERKGHGFGGVGAAGSLDERGFGVLVWRGERPYFVGRGFERLADEAEVAALRAFAADLAATFG